MKEISIMDDAEMIMENCPITIPTVQVAIIV